MAHSAKLTDGTTSYEFVYDPSTQDDFKLRYGMRVDAGEPDARWHQPDSAPPQLIRLTNKPVTIFLTTIVFGDSWDDVMNTVAPIKRWVDGDDQQAARYHTIGDVSQILCRIQLDGMTNYTDWSVIYGFVDDSQAYYSPEADFNTLGYNVVVALTCEPLGKGAPITLRNDLASSPHFLQDSNSDGLSDGWEASSTAATYAINTTTYLTGGKSQQLSIVSASSTRGIKSAAVTASTSTQCVAYLWIRLAANSDRVYVVLRDGSDNDVQAKSFRVNDADGVSDKTAVDSAGNTWYRVVVSGTNTTAANFRLWVVRNSADSANGAVVYLDNAYLQTGTTTAPDAWCSTSAIQNRYDPTSTSAATQARINYLDVWGVPGDSDALVDLLVAPTSTTGTKNTLIVSRLSDRIFNAIDVAHWNDSSSMLLSLFVSGSQSAPSDANRAGGSYIRYTAAASPADGQLEIYPAVGSDEYLKFFSVPHRVFLIARSSNASTAFEWIQGDGIVKLIGESVSFNAANTWEILDIGYTIPIDRAIYDNFGGSAVSALLINITPGAGSATTDIDAALILPAVEDGIIFVTNTTSSTDMRILGSHKQAITDSAFSATPGTAGSLWTIPPGSKMSRYVFTRLNGTTQVHDLTDASTITLTITPRTRHLLGTS